MKQFIGSTKQLSTSEISTLSALVAESTLGAVAARIGVAPESLARLLAGLPVRPGTVLVAREGLVRPDDNSDSEG